MYRLENIRKIFDNRLVAVDDVSMKIAPGERVAVIGPSGAGKTTLFRLLNLTLPPDGGRLFLGDLDVSELHGRALRAARRRIGTIYQQHNLVLRLPVVHNVLAGRLGAWSGWRAVWSLLRPWELDTAHAALSQVSIPEKLYARTDELSGGQQQRVAIARVLIQNPEVILADEPVSSVDPKLAHSIVKLLVEISQTSGKTLLMNLHSVELALTYFPRIIGFRDGRVQFDRPPVEVTEELLVRLYAGVSRPEADEAGIGPDVEFPIASSTPLLPGK
ncbi:MAG: phosphonate ABC transporter ATP-binding protein [Candidatus Methylomirabilales bacterium]